MTGTASSRGGSPPRLPRPQQWFILGPWIFDISAAAGLLAAAPRPPVALDVRAWARAYGLPRDPDAGPQGTSISLIGPGPGFDPAYAMSTDTAEPVIIATLSHASGTPAGPLLIDGCHRLHKAAVTGQPQIPALVLTAAETLGIRRDAALGPGRTILVPGAAR